MPDPAPAGRVRRRSWAPLAAGLAVLAVAAGLIAFDLTHSPTAQLPASITRQAGVPQGGAR